MTLWLERDRSANGRGERIRQLVALRRLIALRAAQKFNDIHEFKIVDIDHDGKHLMIEAPWGRGWVTREVVEAGMLYPKTNE